MSDHEAEDASTRLHRPRGRNRRLLTGAALGTVLAGALFVTATGSAGATGSSLLRALSVTRHSTAAPATKSAPAVTPTPTATPAPSLKSSSAATAVAAPPLTSSGASVALSASEQPSQVGTLMSGSLSGTHHCTASVVDSPAGDLIVTAAHCLGSTGTSDVFVPGYRDGTAPYGVWTITKVLEDSAWTSSRDEDHDVAFAVVAPRNGKSIQSVVGSYGMDTDGVTDSTVQITGYPESVDEPISCTGTSSVFSSSQLTVYCTGYADGTSGSGWVEGYNPDDGSGLLVGVIGGYQTGGDTEDVSYTALFGSDVAALYAQAQAAG